MAVRWIKKKNNMNNNKNARLHLLKEDHRKDKPMLHKKDSPWVSFQPTVIVILIWTSRLAILKTSITGHSASILGLQPRDKAAMLVVNTKEIFLQNLHQNRVHFPAERNAFVLDHQHGRRDVACKPAIGHFSLIQAKINALSHHDSLVIRQRLRKLSHETSSQSKY